MIAHSRTYGQVTFAFTDREGGVSEASFAELNLARHVGDEPSAVEENRRRLATEIGLPAERVVYMNQVHGADVAVVKGTPAGKPGGVRPTGRPDSRGGAASSGTSASGPPAVDAMVTSTPGLALAVLVADCVPVVLADPRAGVLGVAHAGRPGLAAGVVPAVIETMRHEGARDIVAQVGPAICGSCYEVPASMREDVANVIPAAWARTREGTPALDVAGGVRAQLGELGARVDDLADHGYSPCTREDSRYFSYRREHATGRFAGLAWMASG
ncbi:peptidoglycan editing factor PgeF [Actinobacteria bacterium YIM 96077]|uniref:Purine nucleoside phosphorylase n=1 Tax=Phytoactinopolyspora halophila TaxID=1981511 RepID=A0A329QV97_9ACTN|nr:peptidoglycan editing factor PgeF [Phytoactinopolyspora halophila]AYY12847.1 peptidoglycan editing factor PgeF [Actinobacteria bacterium YIM 96077]RAW16360.1 peptidoglycan editing factor PgeF [Phytoactinopolyspora halophila]